jgi:uncharacterized protein (TIGR02145 family)
MLPGPLIHTMAHLQAKSIPKTTANEFLIRCASTCKNIEFEFIIFWRLVNPIKGIIRFRSFLLNICSGILKPKNTLKLKIMPILCYSYLLICGILIIGASSCKKEANDHNYPRGTVKDIQGNTYNTVQIGQQTWMAENLKTTLFKDSTMIPLVNDSSDWSTMTGPAYCWYQNDKASFGNTYGALYNWYAVSNTWNGNRNICPSGWHIPSEAEWDALMESLGGEQVAGGKLKEADTLHWDAPNTGADNETGFTALPGGGRKSDGLFNFIHETSSFWSTTQTYSDAAISINMIHISQGINNWNTNFQTGVSVRCVKD